MKDTNTKAEKFKQHVEGVLCRACHASPAYKNIATFLCRKCWGRWNELRRSAVILASPEEVDEYREGLIAFVEERKRYVWHPESYLYHRPVSSAEAKKHCVSIEKICRQLGYYEPPDDLIVRQKIQRVEEFVGEYMEMHGKLPNVREVMSGTKMDHTTLWACMDYEAYIAGLGGKILTDTKSRFRDEADFLKAASEVVKAAGCPLHMTVILEGIGLCYPAYLANFKSVTSAEIHAAAGVSRDLGRMASLFEIAGKQALADLGYEVEPQAFFPELKGEGGNFLRYDFRVLGTNILVEIDGAQHYDPKNRYYKKTTAKYDRVKDAYAHENGYHLVRIDTRLHPSPKAMKEAFRAHPAFAALNPSNALNTSGPARRGIVRTANRERPDSK